MRKGKIAAQAAHASMKVILDQCSRNNDILQLKLVDPMKTWLTEKFKKVVVYVNSENELMDIYALTKQKNIICSLIVDAGDTEFNGVPTKTTVAIGPDYSNIIDTITGELPLL